MSYKCVPVIVKLKKLAEYTWISCQDYSSWFIVTTAVHLQNSIPEKCYDHRKSRCSLFFVGAIAEDTAS